MRAQSISKISFKKILLVSFVLEANGNFIYVTPGGCESSIVFCSYTRKIFTKVITYSFKEKETY